MPREKQRPKILTVLHQESSSAGRVGQFLVEAGFDLDIRCPPLGDPLPDTLAEHAGAVSPDTTVMPGPNASSADATTAKSLRLSRVIMAGGFCLKVPRVRCPGDGGDRHPPAARVGKRRLRRDGGSLI